MNHVFDIVEEHGKCNDELIVQAIHFMNNVLRVNKMSDYTRRFECLLDLCHLLCPKSSNELAIAYSNLAAALLLSRK